MPVKSWLSKVLKQFYVCNGRKQLRLRDRRIKKDKPRLIPKILILVASNLCNELHSDERLFNQQKFGAGSQLSSASTADFNGDGLLDIVVANRLSADISVLLGHRKRFVWIVNPLLLWRFSTIHNNGRFQR